MCKYIRLAMLSLLVGAINEACANAETKRDADGVQTQEDVHQSFDLQGNIVEEVRQLDTNNDGVVDVKRTITFTRDDKGRLAKTVKTIAEAKSKRCETTTMIYDTSNVLIGEAIEVDTNGDGTADSMLQVTYKYVHGQVVEKSIASSPAVNETPNRRETVKFEYSPDRTQRIRETNIKTQLPSNKVLSTSVSELQYENGKLAVKTTSYDQNGDGQIDKLQRSQFHYNANGILISETKEVDPLQEGTPSVVQTNNQSLDQEFQSPAKKSFWVISANVLMLIILGGLVFRKRWSAARA